MTNYKYIHLPFSASISGATYVGVPHTVNMGFVTCFARPKSASFSVVDLSALCWTYTQWKIYIFSPDAFLRQQKMKEVVNNKQEEVLIIVPSSKATWNGNSILTNSIQKVFSPPHVLRGCIYLRGQAITEKENFALQTLARCNFQEIKRRKTKNSQQSIKRYYFLLGK